MKNGNKTKTIILWSVLGALMVTGLIVIIVGNVLPDGNAFGDVVKKEIFSAAEFSKKFAEGTWGALLGKLFLCALIIAIATVARMVLRMVGKKGNRAQTVITLIDSLITYAAALAAVFLILGALGVNPAAIWASVGILTLIIGLGCQSLITDIVAGLFIVAENEYNVGEIIVVDGFRGTVKEIGIRSTKIIDAAGDIKIINNSDVKDIVNLSR